MLIYRCLKLNGVTERLKEQIELLRNLFRYMILRSLINVMKQFVGCEYGSIIEIADGIKIRFIDAGHLLGSASIEVWLEENGVSKKLVFSGDIGNINKPIVKDPGILHMQTMLLWNQHMETEAMEVHRITLKNW